MKRTDVGQDQQITCTDSLCTFHPTGIIKQRMLPWQSQFPSVNAFVVVQVSDDVNNVLISLYYFFGLFYKYAVYSVWWLKIWFNHFTHHLLLSLLSHVLITDCLWMWWGLKCQFIHSKEKGVTKAEHIFLTKPLFFFHLSGLFIETVAGRGFEFIF